MTSTSHGDVPSHTDESSRALERLTLIAQITNPVVGADPLDSQFGVLLEQVCAAYGVEACVVRELVDPDLELLAAVGIPQSKLKQRVPADAGIARKLIEERCPVVIEHVDDSSVTALLAANARRDPSKFRFLAYAGAPLLVENRVVGILGIYSTEQPRHFTESELNHLQIVANHIAISIVNDRLYRNLSESQSELQTQIEQREQAEAERAKLEAQLRQAQKMEAIGQLAGGVAHDFNNILTAIFGNAELARGALRTRYPDAHEVLDGLHQIERSAQRASSLTRQLLAFSRRQVSRPEILALNSTVHDLKNMFQRLITENIHLELKLGAAPDTVRADPGQLEQVVVNLVVNARDAMPDGGVLSIETSNVYLDESYVAAHPESAAGDHVRLTVSDTGIGMDAATVERVFEPFFTTKPLGQGTGLGLSTTYGIVKQAQGHVTVYSEPGQGTTFRVYFPLASEAADTAPTPSTRPPAPTGKETIITCEDDVSVRDLTVHLLRAAGYNVLSATSPEEALRVAAEHSGVIHLLLTDVIMPEMNGRQLSDILRTIRPEVRTLYVSGYTSNVIAHHGVLEPDVEFMEKPYSRQQLLTRVREVLDSENH